ncbi:XisI protein [Microseira wollei]|uniref:XisI protein n=1 Tax=Microseira wollei NIES-4236 TaxID=2530354 RepID=A0AAV3XQM0_9CYAN|nr:XisI protein [Microseira wollei]GET44076.1 XisI protein [Microseira wollei NIES-4236]
MTVYVITTLNYHDLVDKILPQYAKSAVGEGTEVEVIADGVRGHYLVMFVGWRDEVGGLWEFDSY